ncbi:protein-disulfide reductase DsbD domain-containing protein [Luteolibacter marinus]|uniref:protein-disulfide reductase DsbD domain-containing protein n=1 Tax=Luteolibacter marinus TaxID=2776705 RepID=UPI001865B18D|nr:protein-disulfide reductase DsbD domain-containing protein [Luteolibacter marinus]
MKQLIVLAAGLPLVAPLMAGEKSGHAEAEVLAGVESYQPGKAVPVAVKLKIEPGWHSYWINPGVGGMPLKATWSLPGGWTAGELRQPVPKRFMTGDLPGFGYEGEAVYLVDLLPPSGATGEAECKLELAWLTCNESSCVPGDVSLSLSLPQGDAKAGAAATVIAEARRKIPEPKELGFKVVENGDSLSLMFLDADGIDLAGVSAFPATPDVVDPSDPIKIGRTRDAWTAVVKKSEYADGPATLLEVVLAGGKLDRPVLVSWRADK